MLDVVVVVSWQRVIDLAIEVLEVLRSTSCILVRVVCHVAALLVSTLEALLTRATDGSFLVQVLNVEAATALMSAKATWWSGLQCLILSSSSTLRMQMLP